MKSIMQNDKRCYMCHQTYDLEEHHIFYGFANRKLSEKYGLKVWLCPMHHRGSFNGVHFNKEWDDFLKREAQERFENNYPKLDFRSIFGKSYK